MFICIHVYRSNSLLFLFIYLDDDLCHIANEGFIPNINEMSNEDFGDRKEQLDCFKLVKST